MYHDLSASVDIQAFLGGLAVKAATVYGVPPTVFVPIAISHLSFLISHLDNACSIVAEVDVEAADGVLMDDDPVKIAKAIKISRKCLGIVKQNITIALVIKLACLVLAAFGIANMWLAIIADVGVMIIAVLNAIRCLYTRNL